MAEQDGIVIKILGKEFQVACPAGEEESLKLASEHLNDLMANINKNSKVIGLDKIAIIAALNLSNELLRIKTELSNKTSKEAGCLESLENLQTKLDNVLIKDAS